MRKRTIVTERKKWNIRDGRGRNRTVVTEGVKWKKPVAAASV